MVFTNVGDTKTYFHIHKMYWPKCLLEYMVYIQSKVWKSRNAVLKSGGWCNLSAHLHHVIFLHASITFNAMSKAQASSLASHAARCDWCLLVWHPDIKLSACSRAFPPCVCLSSRVLTFLSLSFPGRFWTVVVLMFWRMETFLEKLTHEKERTNNNNTKHTTRARNQAQKGVGRNISHLT